MAKQPTKNPLDLPKVSVYHVLNDKITSTLLPELDSAGPFSLVILDKSADHRLTDAKTDTYAVVHRPSGQSVLSGIRVKKDAGLVLQSMFKIVTKHAAEDQSASGWESVKEEMQSWLLNNLPMLGLRKGYEYDRK